MSTGWTGGQYSAFRVLFGAYLFVHFVQLVPWGPELFSNRGVLADASVSPLLHLFPNVLALWDTPAFVTALLLAAAGLALLLAVGWRDRIASVALWYIWACLFGRNPLVSNPGIPYVGWLLLAHACLPRAPFGAWDARGRTDPANGWSMPPAIFAAAWVLMAVGYAYSGVAKLGSPSWLDGSVLARVLDNPLTRPGFWRSVLLGLPPVCLQLATWGALLLEIAFAPLALLRGLRPWIWLLMLAMHGALMLLIDFADLSLGMVMLHLFTFNPAWLRAAEATPDTLFYDGYCGLCHRTVRFVLAEDRPGAFRFAPLDSDAFRAAVPVSERAGLPDSIVIVRADGTRLVRSDAVVHVLHRLGGMWRVAGALLAWVPVVFRNTAYDFVGRIRRRLFAPPAAACPLLPPHLRGRFAVDLPDPSSAPE
jgi:predicted DCC family thiol-disulfide oxidoreductase YuxK